jgi:thiol-disulfide isomerase/thioredoxin
MVRPRSLLAALAVVLSASMVPGCKGGAGGGKSHGGAGLDIVPVTGPEVVELVRSHAASVTVLNVWATWCVPCREEMPDLMRAYRAYRNRGLELVLVSADFDDEIPQARAFLREHGVDFTTYIKAGDDAQFIDALDPRWTGALPASFVYGRDGALRYFWEGKASYAQFEERILDVLNEKAGATRQGGAQ